MVSFSKSLRDKGREKSTSPITPQAMKAKAKNKSMTPPTLNLGFGLHQTPMNQVKMTRIRANRTKTPMNISPEFVVNLGLTFI